VALFAVLTTTAVFAQSKSFWTKVPLDRAQSTGKTKESFQGITNNLFQLNIEELKLALENAPDRSSAATGIIIGIPNLDGNIEHFRMYEASNFDPELQSQYPGIRAYAGYGIEDASAILRMSVSHLNVQTMILRADRQSEFIEPFNENATAYAVFSSGMTRTGGRNGFTCLQPDEVIEVPEGNANRNGLSSNGVLKTFRLALSCTAEYTQYHGGTVANALAAMNATITRVNGVYERDIAVRLVIIPNNTSVIYTNPGTDPYTNMGQWSGQLQQTLNTTIGAANYDIGHLFGATGGGGFAGCIGCVCNNSNKGSGYTSPGNGGPEGDSFDIDYVAHEMGHQLGANHTYSVDYEGEGVNIEPGSGSTIMGYAGITGPTTDIQQNSDDYFHYASISQIQSNLANKTCPTNTTINNPAMTINAGIDYSIPRGTAFVLRAVNANANPANVTYTWEQMDDANTSSDGNQSVPSPTKLTGATFRSLPPSSSPNRYMPALGSVLNGNLTTQWETVSNVARTLNFVLTGRDNVLGGGQTKSDAMRVFVRTNAGPFTVTSQNTPNISWEAGSTQTITWNVAATNAGTVATANVNILLSTDNGQTFTTVLAANTPNDGSHVITVPNVAGPFCRIMVEAAGNIYYAVNQVPFAIGYLVTTDCNTYSNNTALSIPDGSNTYATSVINVPATGTLSDVNVGVTINHGYVSDLIVGLWNPTSWAAGQDAVLLWQMQCDDRNNINVTFDDSGSSVICGNPTTGNITPVGSLASFNGQQTQGNWVLGVVDPFNGDAGTLVQWSVEICTQSIQPLSTTDFSLENFKIYPNPNNGTFTVEFNSSSAQEVAIAVHDMRGREIFKRSYENTGLFSGNVNLGNVETGVYLVTVTDGARKDVKRIVVN